MTLVWQFEKNHQTAKLKSPPNVPLIWYCTLSYCYITGAPHITTNTILNITGVDHTVVTGIRTNPCLYQFNRSYAFVCNVSGLPTPQVTWYYQRILLGEITLVTANSTNGYVQYNVDSTTSVLVISNMTRSNAGIYYCNATNDVGFDLLAIEAIVASMYG